MLLFLSNNKHSMALALTIPFPRPLDETRHHCNMIWTHFTPSRIFTVAMATRAVDDYREGNADVSALRRDFTGLFVGWLLPLVYPQHARVAYTQLLTCPNFPCATFAQGSAARRPAPSYEMREIRRNEARLRSKMEYFQRLLRLRRNIEPGHDTFQFRPRRRLPRQHQRIMARDDVAVGGCQSAQLAVALEHVEDILVRHEHELLFEALVVMRRVGGDHDGAAGRVDRQGL